MATATYATSRRTRIDGIATTTSSQDLYVGPNDGAGDPTKYQQFRVLMLIDLHAAPVAGVSPPPGSPITAAQLDLNVINSSGGAAVPCTLYRVTREDMAGFPDTHWVNYKSGTPWTTPGGDVDASQLVHFTGPAGLGAFAIAGLAAIVDDALDNHAGVLVVEIRADSDTPPGAGTHQWNIDRVTTPPTLTITYTASTDVDARDPATLPGDRPARAGAPSGAARPARPARPARR